MNRASAFDRALIEKEANANGIDPDFLEAVYLQEGGDRLFSYNYEWDGSKYIHGPMAISLDEAYTAGYSPSDLTLDANRNAYYSPALASPELSIKFGARYLAQYGLTVGCEVGDYYCYAAAYDSRSISYGEGGYSNQSYVDGVMDFYNQIKGGSNPDTPEAPPPSNFPKDSYFPCVTLEKNNSAYIPRSPYAPYLSVIYTSSNGVSIDLASGDDGRPRYITYFEYHETLGGLGTARVRLFDTGGDIILEAISGNAGVQVDTVGNPKTDPDSPKKAATSQFSILDNVKLTFGYAPSVEEEIKDASIFGTIFPGRLGEEERKIDPLNKFVAPRKEMFLQNYQPRFLGYGVELDLVFADASAIAALEEKTRTFTNDGGTDGKEAKVIASGQQGGVPEEGSQLGIVETICKEHGWQACTAATSELINFDTLDDNTESNRHIVQTGKDDMAFIREKLIPASKVKGEQSAGYMAYVDSSTKPSTLHFHPPNLRAPSDRVYRYTRSRNGTVIRFEPVVNGELIALFGGISATYAGINPVTKQTISTKASSDDDTGNNSPGASLPSEKTYQEDGVDGVVEKTVKPNTVRNSPDRDLEEQRGAVQSFRQSGSLAALSGQLVVLGDPKIRAGMNIDLEVEVFNPSGSGDALGWDYLADATKGILGSLPFVNQPASPKELYFSRGLHYTSGKWHVLEVRHIIQGGEYLTYLELMRNTLLSPGFNGGVDETGTSTLNDLNVPNNLNTR